MSAGIPPTWLSSIIQTQGAKANAAQHKQKEDAARAEATGQDSFANRLQDVIDSNDRDSQVYSDAEGAGSQGRPFEENPPDEQAPDEDPGQETPSGGLDVQA